MTCMSSTILHCEIYGFKLLLSQLNVDIFGD